MSEKKGRQLNYEVMRIAAMLMIVCLHYFGKGGLLGNPSDPDMTATGYTVWFLEALCLAAVNIYVLISGYFGVGGQVAGQQAVKRQVTEQPREKQSKFRITVGQVLQRPFRIWKQVIFYSVVIGVIACLVGGQKPDIYQIFTYLFPIVTEHYWFATSYVILCLMMPFLNAGLTHLSRYEIKNMILGMLLIFSISKTILPMQLPWDKYGYDAFWFMVLYLTGGYIRRFGIAHIKGRGQALLLYLVSAALIFALFVALRVVSLKTGKLEDLVNYSYTYNHLFCYTAAIGAFLFFAQVWEYSQTLERIRKPIELLSSATFGVYLIHEHIDIRSQWPKWFHCEEQGVQPVGVLLIHMVCTVLMVYVTCTVIEIIRIKLAAFIFGKNR